MRRWLPVALLLSLFVGLAVTSARQKSSTWDETHYLGVGTHLLKTGRWDIPSAGLHPPLGFYLSGLPLLFADLDDACLRPGPSADLSAAVNRGRCLLAGSGPSGGPSGDQLLFLARLPEILVGALLGLLIYLEARRLLGELPALVSLGLFATSPTLLAHARLATPDVLFAACAGACVFAIGWAVRAGGVARFALAGAAFGATLLTKYAALLFLPVVLLLLLAAALLDPSARRPALRVDRRRLAGTAVFLLAAALTVLAAYRFQPAPWIEGIRAQETIVGAGFPAYLNGVVSTEGFPHYYFVAFLVKEPVATLALLALGLGLLLLRRRLGWFDALQLLLPPVAVFGAFWWYRNVNLGIRYVLPAYPFLLVAAGGAGLLLEGTRRKVGLFVIAPLLLWQLVACVWIHPHYLAYFNEPAGGPAGGHRHLVDSNLDWGQDLKLLARWMEEESVDQIALSYFGSADPRQYGIEYEALPSFFLPSDSRPCQSVDPGDVVVVSATNLHEVFVQLGPLGELLRSARPRARIGYSLYVYDFR